MFLTLEPFFSVRAVDEEASCLTVVGRKRSSMASARAAARPSFSRALRLRQYSGSQAAAREGGTPQTALPNWERGRERRGLSPVRPFTCSHGGRGMTPRW